MLERFSKMFRSKKSVAEEGTGTTVYVTQTGDVGTWKPLLNPRSRRVLDVEFSSLPDYGKLVYLLHKLYSNDVISGEETETLQILQYWGARCPLNGDLDTALTIFNKRGSSQCDISISPLYESKKMFIYPVFSGSFPQEQAQADAVVEKIVEEIPKFFKTYGKAPASV